MSRERSVLELQRASLELLLAGVEPYFVDQRLKVLCVVPASPAGGGRYAGDWQDRRSRSPANWLMARVHPPTRQLVSSLDCQYRDSGFVFRETGEAAATVNVGDIRFRTGTNAEVGLQVRRSRTEYMTFKCQAKLRERVWTVDQCLCETQRGAAAVCLVI